MGSSLSAQLGHNITLTFLLCIGDCVDFMDHIGQEKLPDFRRLGTLPVEE